MELLHVSMSLTSKADFKFCVSALEVGFETIRGGNISFDLFNLDFLLWGAGDPDLHINFPSYQKSTDQNWTIVSRSGNLRSYGDVVQETCLVIL